MRIYAFLRCVLASLSLLTAPAHAKEELESIVLLLDTPREITEERFEAVLEDVFDHQFQRDDAEADYWIGPRVEDVIPFSVGGQKFIFHDRDTHYFSEKAKNSMQKNIRLRILLKSEQAWLAVDWLQSSGGEKSDAYVTIGMTLNGLLDDDVVGLFAPAEGAWTWMHEGVRETLPKGELNVIFDHPNPPVQEVAPGDPKMAAAVAEAKRRWTEFADAFQAASDEDRETFACKIGFSDEGQEQSEFMWVSIKSIDGETISGVLDNEPISVKSVKLDDTVTFKLEELNDWLYYKDGKAQGGFTVKVLEEAHRQAEEAEEARIRQEEEDRLKRREKQKQADKKDKAQEEKEDKPADEKQTEKDK
jgi:uncharacterized protein YegJ (DUF2314 family)